MADPGPLGLGGGLGAGLGVQNNNFGGGLGIEFTAQKGTGIEFTAQKPKNDFTKDGKKYYDIEVSNSEEEEESK